MFGEIAPRPLGNINNTSYQISSLVITGNADLFNAPTNSLNVTGNSFLNGSVTSAGLLTGNSGLSITGAVNINTSGSSVINLGTGTATGQITLGNITNNANPVNINSNGQTIAVFSSAGNAPQIEIASGGILRAYLGYNTVNGVLLTNGNSDKILYQTSGGFNDASIRTFSNILDDGGGGCSFATSGSNAVNIGTSTYTGQITIGNTSNNLSPLIQGGTSSNAALTINSTSSGGSYLYVNRSGSNLVAFGSGVGKPLDIYDFGAGNSWLYNNGTHGNVSSANTTLDDGSGIGTFAGLNILSTGSNDPILKLRRSSYSTNFISRIKFVDDNTSGNYWEIGTDVNGNKGGDFYFYGQGGSGLGLAMQLTAKGYLYLGYGMPWFKTTVTTPSTGNQTITAAQLLGYLVDAPITSSAFTWTTDTGTNIYSAMGSPQTGTTFKVLFSNNNNSAGAVMTIAFGSGVTGNLRGNTLNNNSSMEINFRCTGTNTFTCYS